MISKIFGYVFDIIGNKKHGLQFNCNILKVILTNESGIEVIKDLNC